jgi:hypothetical protein
VHNTVEFQMSYCVNLICEKWRLVSMLTVSLALVAEAPNKMIFNISLVKCCWYLNVNSKRKVELLIFGCYEKNAWVVFILFQIQASNYCHVRSEWRILIIHIFERDLDLQDRQGVSLEKTQFLVHFMCSQCWYQICHALESCKLDAQRGAYS